MGKQGNFEGLALASEEVDREASVGKQGNFEGLTLASDTEKDKFEGLALTPGKAHHKVS